MITALQTANVIGYKDLQGKTSIRQIITEIFEKKILAANKLSSVDETANYYYYYFFFLKMCTKQQ